MSDEEIEIPRIKALGSHDGDFHDSSLLRFDYDPVGDTILAVVSTPYPSGRFVRWNIHLSGILEIRMETVGSGERRGGRVPPEVYDIFDDVDGERAARWNSRLRTLGWRGTCT